jgi:hypothetical protein
MTTPRSPPRRFQGSVSTHCRCAARGKICSSQASATTSILRAPQEAQNVSRLQENGTRRCVSQPSQVSHAKPCSGSPQER